MRTRSRFFIIVAIVGLAVVAGGLRGIFAAQARVIPRHEPPPTPEVLGNGWYKFTDVDAGYSINYPSDARLDAHYQADLEFKLITVVFPKSVGEANQEMEITVFSNRERSSLPDLVKQKIYRGRLPKNIKVVSLTAVRVAGFDAEKLEIPPFYPALLFSAKGKVYFVALPMNLLRGNPPTQVSVDLFYQIINTFTLN